MPAIVAIRAKHMPAHTAHDLIRGHGPLVQGVCGVAVCRGHGPLVQGV